MTWTLVIAAATFAAGWYFGRLERTGCEAWADALFRDLGQAEADLADLRAQLRNERDLADRLAKEATYYADGSYYLAEAIAALDEARGRS